MTKSRQIDTMKLLLLLGVVMIHCSVRQYYVAPTPEGERGVALINLLPSFLNECCVPCFFILSGYLFFRNSGGRFSARFYLDKLKSRSRTLLLPYLLWNAICAVLLFIKVRWLGYDGCGIVVDGHVRPLALLAGFWSCAPDGFPLAFAFWFIRNLMVMVVLSPVVWLVARRPWSLIAFLGLTAVLHIKLQGGEWFILGSAYALCGGGRPLPRFGTAIGLAGAAVAAASFALRGTTESYALLFILKLVLVGGMFAFFASAAQVMLSLRENRLTSLLAQAAFFIYAFHQCWCTLNDRFWTSVVGLEHLWSAPLVFLLSFFAITAASTVAYMLLRRLCPRLLGLLTGGRF